MLADEACDCLAALAHGRRNNVVAGVAAGEEAVGHVGEVESLRGWAARLDSLVPANETC